MKKLLLILLYVVTTSISSAQSIVTNDDVDTLRAWMTGSFSTQLSNDSSQADLHLNINSIWKHRLDGAWLYAEQSSASSLNKPFYQVVYHLFRLNDSTIVNQVYEVKNPSRIIGAWHNPGVFEDLHTDSLKLKVGCAIMIHKSGNTYYYGSTSGKECGSTGTAAYITSEVKIFRDRIISWERAWDMYDKQLWGSNSGKEFIRRN